MGQRSNRSGARIDYWEISASLEKMCFIRKVITDEFNKKVAKTKINFSKAFSKSKNKAFVQ